MRPGRGKASAGALCRAASRACQRQTHLALPRQSLTAQHCVHHAPVALVVPGAHASACGLGFPPPTSPKRPASKAAASPPSKRLPAALPPCNLLAGAPSCVPPGMLEGCAARKLKSPLCGVSRNISKVPCSCKPSWPMKLPELLVDTSADVKPIAPLVFGSSCSPRLVPFCISGACESALECSGMSPSTAYNAECMCGCRKIILVQRACQQRTMLYR